MRFARLVLFALVLVALATGAFAVDPFAELSHVLQSGRFDVVPSAYDLPLTTQQAIASFGDLTPADAPPTRRYVDGTRATLRFVWSVKKPPLYIVHVEVIGPFHFFQTLAVRGSEGVMTWPGDRAPYADFNSFRANFLKSHHSEMEH
jgi:hypothetical protein